MSAERSRAIAAAVLAFDKLTEAGTDPVEASDWIEREMADLAFRGLDLTRLLAAVKARRRAA